MTNGILRFNTNGPVEVPLRWGDGTRVEEKYREQAMYTLDDDSPEALVDPGRSTTSRRTLEWAAKGNLATTLFRDSGTHCDYFFFPHRAAAALRAISWRCSFVRARARALPPTFPPLERSSAVKVLARSFPRATAALFFIGLIRVYLCNRLTRISYVMLDNRYICIVNWKRKTKQRRH